jgi:hypothetical protein
MIPVAFSFYLDARSVFLLAPCCFGSYSPFSVKLMKTVIDVRLIVKNAVGKDYN